MDRNAEERPAKGEKHALRVFRRWETSEHTGYAPYQGVSTGALSPDIAHSIPKSRTNSYRAGKSVEVEEPEMK